MTPGYSSRLINCLASRDWGGIGAVEAAVYGSLVRGDFAPGCSDLDLFIVTARPILDPAGAEALARQCLHIAGIRVRGVDIAWCHVDEVLSGRCRYKFLTVYRKDFDRHHVMLHGRPLHALQPPLWSIGERCSHILRVSRREGLREVAAGEAVKLLLIMRGYHGPWDRYSVAEAVAGLGDECAVEVWRSYLECGKAGRECVGAVLEALVRECAWVTS